MTKTITVYYAAEKAHVYALAAARRAIRGGDIALAERWIRLSERHWRCSERAHRNFEERLAFQRSRKTPARAQGAAAK
jgi:hypothetical protein